LIPNIRQKLSRASAKKLLATTAAIAAPIAVIGCGEGDDKSVEGKKPLATPSGEKLNRPSASIGSPPATVCYTGGKLHAPKRVQVGANQRHYRALDGFTGQQAARKTPEGRGFGLGSKGLHVLHVKQHLKHGGFPPRNMNSTFDPDTLARVCKFQRSVDLKDTGRINVATWKALQEIYVYTEAKPSKVVTAYVNGVARNITVVSVGNGEWMRADAAAAFEKLVAAGKRAGFNLYPYSGFRTYGEQRILREAYDAGRGNPADPPGYSNHQGGISQDIGGIESYSTAAYAWMKANAPKFGFQNNAAPPEFWHWTYTR
jgi:hypothetical protein